MANTMIQPQAILFDYFNTVVRRVRFEHKLGLEALLKLAELPSSITIDEVMTRDATLEARLGEIWESSDVWSTAQQYQRLLFDGLGVRFRVPPEELEKHYLEAAMGFERTEGVDRCLANLRSRGLRLAVVSNHVCTGEALRSALDMHRSNWHVRTPSEAPPMTDSGGVRGIKAVLRRCANIGQESPSTR